MIALVPASSASWPLWVGLGLVATGLAGASYLAVAAREPRARVPRRSLRSDALEPQVSGDAGERLLGSVRSVATGIASKLVARSERQGLIDARLDRAGLVMRAGEFVAAVFGAAVLGALLLSLALGPIGMLVGAVLPVAGASPLLGLLANRRNAKFASQLGDVLVLMSGSLRAGLGLGSAIDSVGQEFGGPIGVEFQRAILESRLGRSMDDSLQGVADRMRNEDFAWVVDAIRINRQVGGDLSTILDRVSETIRARHRLRRQVDALTAEGRMSALVLGALPIVLAAAMYVTNPDYLRPLFDSTTGNAILGAAVVMLIVGAAWLKKLISVEEA